MSAFAYGRIAGQNKDKAGDEKSRLAEVLTALIPADVLIAHQAVITLATRATVQDGQTKYEIMSAVDLKVTFIVLTVAASAVYAISRLSSGATWSGRDWVKLLIPAVAFVAWTVIQPISAFNGFVPDPDRVLATLFAAVAAIILAPLASALVEPPKKSS